MVLSDHVADPDPSLADRHNAIERLRDRTHTRNLSSGAIVDLFASAGLGAIRSTEEAFTLDFDEWFDRGTPASTKAGGSQPDPPNLRSARGFRAVEEGDGRVTIHCWRAIVRGVKPADGSSRPSPESRRRLVRAGIRLRIHPIDARFENRPRESDLSEGRVVMRHSPICRRFALLAWAALLTSVAAPVARSRARPPTPSRPRRTAGPPPGPRKRPSPRPSPRPRPSRATPSPTRSRPRSKPPGTSTNTRRRQPSNGPKYTEFDFFDPAGLKVAGRLVGLVDADQEEGAGLPRLAVPRIPRRRGDLEHQAPGPRRCAARQEDASLPDRLHDLLGRELQLPRPVDPARRRADRPARLRRRWIVGPMASS